MFWKINEGDFLQGVFSGVCSYLIIDKGGNSDMLKVAVIRRQARHCCRARKIFIDFVMKVTPYLLINSKLRKKKIILPTK